MLFDQIHKPFSIYVSLIITVLYPSLSWGTIDTTPICTDYLGTIGASNLYNDPYKSTDQIEKRLNMLLDEISSKFGTDHALNSKLNSVFRQANDEFSALLKLQERVLEGEIIPAQEFVEYHGRLDAIRKAMVEEIELTEAHRTKASEQKQLKLNDLILDPLTVEAERPYLVDLVSGNSLSVIISDNIVKTLLKDPSKQRVVSRSLKKIQLGVFGSGYEGDGVIKMKLDPNVVEIRASGKDGNFRFFGYLEKDRLHLVLYSISSDHHKTSTVLKNVKNVIAIKQQRGH